jgi:hypothetical protein
LYGNDERFFFDGFVEIPTKAEMIDEGIKESLEP